jgi:hypothetical protein
VDEFVDEGAAFARVGDAPVDEHGVGGEAVYAVEFAGKPRAGHMQVWCNVVQCHAHLPVAHARRQWQRHRITHLLFWRTRIPRHPHCWRWRRGRWRIV